MTDTIIWSVMAVLIAIVLVALAAWAYKGKKLFKPWTDEKWIEVGGILLLAGYLLSMVYNDGFNTLMVIGALYLIVGLAKKYAVKKTKGK